MTLELHPVPPPWLRDALDIEPPPTELLSATAQWAEMRDLARRIQSCQNAAEMTGMTMRLQLSIVTLGCDLAEMVLRP
jgi:hypothetical protein